MGTSVNQRSPDTTNWKLVQQAYENPDFPIERALREVWQAASNQEQGDLIAQLAEPTIGSLVSVAARSISPADASRAVGDYIADNLGASLAADIATRAVIQSAGRPDAQSFFVQRLFAEATDYLVSRDLPGHISPGSRLGSISAARAFKQDMMRTTASTVQQTPLPSSFEDSQWTTFVNTVVGAIRRRR